MQMGMLEIEIPRETKEREAWMVHWEVLEIPVPLLKEVSFYITKDFLL